MEGKVKSIPVDRETGNRKGFGFIEPSTGGAQIFFHNSAVQGGRWQSLKEGDTVTYEPGEGAKGPRAENIHVV